MISHTENPELIVAIAGKNCYSDKSLSEVVSNGMSTEEIRKFIKKLIELGHTSALEHASFTFAVEGVSRALLAQITRHRMGSYSVKSQRYVNEHDFDFVTPSSITEKGKKEEYEKCVEHIRNSYNELLKFVPKEDARFVLPNACTTQFVVTMNARSLLNFFELRCCNRAQWEIRELADEMLKLCKKVAPTIFENAGASCVRGKCSEGKMSCGKPRKEMNNA